MEKVNKKSFFLTAWFLLLYNLLPAYAGTPVIYSITPQFIQQGQITTSIITGVNLNSSVIGTIGNGVYAVILKQEPQGNSLTVQFATQPTSELGDREFFLRTEEGEAKFPIKVIPSGAPTIENINPSSASPGSTLLLYITGMGLTNPVISTPSDQILINSYRASSNGSALYVSLSLTPNVIPGIYQIYVNTLGGQAQADFIVSSAINNLDPINPDSPDISLITSEPGSNNRIVLKGTMFDPDPLNNIVTILENNNGTVTGRQVEVVSSSNNEIVINLPEDITSESISIAVSSLEGKSSNIKTIDLNSLSDTLEGQTETASSTATEEPVLPTKEEQTITNTTVTTIAENNTSPTILKPNEVTIQETSKQNETLQIQDKTPESNIPVIAEDINTNHIPNIQTLSQYLFSNVSNDVRQEASTPSLEQIEKSKDPIKLITAIEEDKQLKNQADLIMIALENAKENKELSEAVKKTEGLKAKVDELEKLLTAEKNKNNPDPRKLAKYEQLLQSANSESKSQTFALLNNLLKYKPQLKNLLSQKPLDLAAIQPNIPSNSVILQYVPTEEGLIIFVVDHDNLKIRINKNISKDILSREVQAYRQLFEKEIEKIKLTGRVTPILSWKNDKSNTYKKDILPLKEKNIFLYNALIGPVEKDIANKKVVAIIANGWLRYLPFQSLGKPTKDGEMQFLINDKSIVSLDSVIAISKNSSPSLSGMANITVLANPDGTLTGANKEAEIISMLFSKTTTALTQQRFNTSLINQLSKKADILHLATHGYLDGIDIESSYLVSGKTQNGKKVIPEKLYLKDIYDLKLQNNKLVVLSGCDTGKLGNLLNEPDDIVGSLASAFRVAGSNTILASLWKAHDEATKIIMQNFYENLKLGIDKAEALRRAELKVKSNPQYGHPLFWSLFNLIGDWR